MIRHSVIFKFKEGISPENVQKFLEASAQLADIPGVIGLEILKQVSPKNKYDYGILMNFQTGDAYISYNNHLQHQAFIKDFWMPMVSDFLEIDFEEIS